MNNNFDFNDIGKRMPYTIPDSFFDKLERDTHAKVFPSTATHANRLFPSVGMIVRGVVAAAAVAALLITVNMGLKDYKTDNFANVERAFDDLNQDDKDYMLTTYNEDIFINDQNLK